MNLESLKNPLVSFFGRYILKSITAGLGARPFFMIFFTEMKSIYENICFKYELILHEKVDIHKNYIIKVIKYI